MVKSTYSLIATGCNQFMSNDHIHVKIAFVKSIDFSTKTPSLPARFQSIRFILEIAPTKASSELHIFDDCLFKAND